MHTLNQAANNDVDGEHKHEGIHLLMRGSRRSVVVPVGTFGEDDKTCCGYVDPLYIYAPIILFTTLCFGGIVYYFLNPGWDPALCYFYSAQALFGVMYGTPGDEQAVSKGFTMVFYLWGQLLLLTAFAVMVEEMIDKAPEILKDERMKIIDEEERRQLGHSNNCLLLFF